MHFPIPVTGSMAGGLVYNPLCKQLPAAVPWGTAIVGIALSPPLCALSHACQEAGFCVLRWPNQAGKRMSPVLWLSWWEVCGCSILLQPLAGIEIQARVLLFLEKKGCCQEWWIFLIP